MPQTNDTQSSLPDGRPLSFRRVFYLIGPILDRGVAQHRRSAA
jgi:hypothetical protein